MVIQKNPWQGYAPLGGSNIQLTQAEYGWAKHIEGKYAIADFVLDNIDENLILTFSDPFELKELLEADGCQNMAVMLSDETALQRLFFWLS